MNMHWSSSKTDSTIKFSIQKLYENTPFHNSNVTHGGRNNYQVTQTFKENQGNTLNTHGGRNNYQVTITFKENQGNKLNNTEKIKVDEHTLVLIENKLHH